MTQREARERLAAFYAADVEYADEDNTGQLGLGVPGEQRAIPTLARPVEDIERCECGRELDENGEHDGGYGGWCG